MVKYCSYCGKEALDEFNYCPKCGKDIIYYFEGRQLEDNPLPIKPNNLRRLGKPYKKQYKSNVKTWRKAEKKKHSRIPSVFSIILVTIWLIFQAVMLINLSTISVGLPSIDLGIQITTLTAIEMELFSFILTIVSIVLLAIRRHPGIVALVLFVTGVLWFLADSIPWILYGIPTILIVLASAGTFVDIPSKRKQRKIKKRKEREIQLKKLVIE